MAQEVLEPGALGLITGPRSLCRELLHEIIFQCIADDDRAILVCDGDHSFNPYQLGELQLRRGKPAEIGAKQVLVKRAMTPFQWDSILTKQLPSKLLETEAQAVLIQPFDRLWMTDELREWEQEDYLRASLRILRREAEVHQVPMLLFADVARMFHTHPSLATILVEAFPATKRWTVHKRGPAWRLEADVTLEMAFEPRRRDRPTLWDFDPRATPPRGVPIPLLVQSRRRPN